MNEKELLDAIKKSYVAFINHGSRSPKKLHSLHGVISKKVHEVLDNGFEVNSMSYGREKEDKFCGLSYDKRVDISILKNGEQLGAIAVKFATSNYNQNANNYFEQMIGETFNLRGKSIIYIQVLIIRNPIPYRKQDREKGDRIQHMKDYHMAKYRKLLDVSIQQYGVPNLFFIKMVNINNGIDSKDNVDINDVEISEFDIDQLADVTDKTKAFYEKYSHFDKFLKSIKTEIYKLSDNK